MTEVDAVGESGERAEPLPGEDVLQEPWEQKIAQSEQQTKDEVGEI